MFKQVARLLVVLAVGGCAAIEIPPDRLERNQATLRSAEEVGALTVPSAKLHLQMAKDQTALAKRMASNGNDRAVLVLSRSDSDAELALALAREATVHTDALKAAEDLKAVKARGQ